MKDLFLNKRINEKEIAQKKLILKSYPRRCLVTLCSRCNLNCIMCEVKEAKWEIPQKAIEEIIGLFPYFENILWQGGEIFLLDYFENIFRVAAQYDNLRQTIVTNGILINERWAEKLVRGNVELFFSIDGVTKSVYEHIRKGAQFSQIMKSIEMINSARSRFINERMSFKLHAVIMKSNYQDLEKFIDFAHEYNFDAVHLIPLWGNLNSQENIYNKDNDSALEYIESINSLIEAKAKNYKIQLLNFLPKNDKNYQDAAKEPSKENINQLSNGDLFCYFPWQQLNIDPGGNVRPDCLCLKPIGNITEDSLEKLWNNRVMQNYRKRIIENNFAGFCPENCIIGQKTKKLK